MTTTTTTTTKRGTTTRTSKATTTRKKGAAKTTREGGTRTSKAKDTPKKKGTASSASPTPKKEEPKPTKEQWVANNPQRVGTDGREHPTHRAWLTNYEGDQTPQRGEHPPTHQDDPRGWLLTTIREAIEQGGWSSRQLAIATGGVATKTPSGKTRLVGGVSLGQIASLLKGGSCSAETAARLLAALGFSLTR